LAHVSFEKYPYVFIFPVKWSGGVACCFSDALGNIEKEAVSSTKLYPFKVFPRQTTLKQQTTNKPQQTSSTFRRSNKAFTSYRDSCHFRFYRQQPLHRTIK
jgi:hypothetical protein